MNGITYFKLNSPYEGDVTKNCALTGSEVDNNFYVLESRDIKSVELVDDKIVVNLMNGEKLTTDGITHDCIKDLNIEFDAINGVLKITQDGVTQEISGFATDYNLGDAISVDGSLAGNGKALTPIGISPVYKTGQYKPVKSIVKINEGEKLPSLPYVYPGDRYLTVENVNEFGYLYNYEGLKRIACKLREAHSEWRIPTKEDWDDLLDSVEPCEDFRNHTDARSNKFLGRFAGKFLKSKEYWKKDDCDSSCGDENSNCFDQNTPSENCGECNCGRNTICHPDYCGEYGSCHHRHRTNNQGIDKYGFRVVPAGYANEAKDYMYFKERAYFWTASNHEFRDAYIKAFAYNKSKVLQDIFATDNYLSVRLVKNFNGDNYNEREDILGTSHSTVFMPSLKHGQTIWTSENISIADCGCDCHGSYILPNDGEGMVYKKKYFINEWTSKGWLRKELADGESVVVISDIVETQNPNNVNCTCPCGHEDNEYVANYTEYRVVEGELVDVSKVIFDKVVSSLDSEFDRLNNNINTLQEQLESEITRSTTKDVELENAINNFDETITERIAAEEQARIEKDNQLEAKDDELEARIAAEEQARAEKDNDLEGKILTPNGTVFNNGILTLKSKDGTNDIDVQFDFNFGTF